MKIRGKGRWMAVLLTLALLGLWGEPAQARRGDRLLTGQGVLTLGGRFAFEFAHVSPDGGNSQTGLLLNFSPTFGVFVVRNLLLNLGVTARIGLADLYRTADRWLAMGVGIEYLFNFRSIVVPYLGIELGPAFDFPQDGGRDGAGLFVTHPAGILIALNGHLGLMIGTQFTLTAMLSGSAKGVFINLPVGYLGVRGFF